MTINKLFDLLDDWRNLPAYQLKNKTMRKLLFITIVLLISISSFAQKYYISYTNTALKAGVTTPSLIKIDGIKVLANHDVSKNFVKIPWTYVNKIYYKDISEKVLNRLKSYSNVKLINLKNSDIKLDYEFAEEYIIVETNSTIKKALVYNPESIPSENIPSESIIPIKKEYVIKDSQYWRYAKNIRGMNKAYTLTKLSAVEYREYIEWRRKRANKILGIGLGGIGAGVGISFGFPPVGIAISIAGGITYIVGVFMK